MNTISDRVFEGIVRASQCPDRRQSVRSLIDPYILRGYADPDEMRNEDRINCSHGRLFRRIDEFDGNNVDSAGLDFRDAIDFHGCACVDGETCILCCTEADFAALSSFRTKKRGAVFGRDPIGREAFHVSVSRFELEDRQHMWFEF